MPNNYPKVISTREGCGMTSIWNEYLRLDRDNDGIGILEVCRYEAIGELDDDVEDYDAALMSLPAEINGKKVFGVENGQYIVGGELARYDDRVLAYAANEIDVAVQWLEAQHFKVDDDLVHQLRRAVV